MSPILKSWVHPWTFQIRQDGFVVSNGLGNWIVRDFSAALMTFVRFNRKFPKGYKE